MVGQNTEKQKIVDWILRVILLIAALSCLIPILNTVAISFSSKVYANEVFLLPNMSRTGERHYFCCINSVCIACLGWHETVRCEQDRSRKIVKFLLLILPCCTKVTF